VGKKNRFIYLSLIILLTIITFSNSLFNGLINYDDPGYIVKNELIRGLSFHNLRLIFSSFVMGNYHPFVVLSDAIIYYFFKLNPLPYHAFSLLLHLVNVVLVFELTYKLFGYQQPATSSQQPDIQVSAVIACLFAIHPMHCESVCWASDLKDLLFTLFYLASLIFYVKYIKKSTDHGPQSMGESQKFHVKAQRRNGQKSIFYIISLILFVFSCMSKSAAVTLPVVMIATDYLIKRKINIKTIVEKIPFFVLSIVFGIVNIYSQAANIYLQKAADPNFDLSNYNIAERIFFPIYDMGYYLVSSVIPYKLSLIHPYPEVGNNVNLPIEYYIYPVVLIMFIFLIFRKLKRQNKDDNKYIIFGLIFFIVNLILVLQIVPVGKSIVSERYSYLSYFGLFFLIGGFLKFKVQSSKFKVQVNTVVVLIILIFSFISFQRNKVWSNSISMFNDVVEKYPGVYIAYEQRANAKDALGDKRGALDDYDKAIELNPLNAETFNNRGNTEDDLGNHNQAIEDYNKAIKLNPKYTDAYYNRGIAKYSISDFKGAIEDYNVAIALNPQFAMAFNHRGLARASLGDFLGAKQDFSQAIEINPQSALSYFNRGLAEYLLNDFRGAIQDYNKAIEINPQNAQGYNNRAIAEHDLGDRLSACNDWKLASELGLKEADEMMMKYCQ